MNILSQILNFETNNFIEKDLINKIKDSLNEINILDLYLKSKYKDKDFKYNEKEVNFQIFDQSTSNLPLVCSSNPSSFSYLYNCFIKKNMLKYEKKKRGIYESNWYCCRI